MYQLLAKNGGGIVVGVEMLTHAAFDQILDFKYI